MVIMVVDNGARRNQLISTKNQSFFNETIKMNNKLLLLMQSRHICKNIWLKQQQQLSLSLLVIVA